MKIQPNYSNHSKPCFAKIVLMLLFLFSGILAWGQQTYTHTITAKTFDASPQTKTLSSVDWTLVNNGGYYGYDGTKGQQVGSASSPAKSMTLSTSGITGTITSVKIETSGASSIDATVAVNVGGSAYGGVAQIISSTNTAYTFTGSASGDIEFVWTQTSSKALYFKKITIVYSSAPDITPPTLSTLNPVNNAMGVGLSSNLVATFSENVVKGTGDILIKKNSDNSIFQTIAVSNAAVSISGAIVTINPNDFDYSTAYFVEIPNGAFEDAAGNDFAGFSGNGTWLFTTLSQAPPVINSSLTKSTVYGTADTYIISATNPPNTYSTGALPSGFSLSGATISKQAGVVPGTYSISITATNSGGSDTKTLVWTVTAKNLTITGLSGNNKVYDGNTTATISGTPTLNGVVGGDVVNVSGTPTATFNNKNVGNNKPITVTGYTLSGAQAGNYTLTQPTGITGNISAKALTVSGAIAQNKVYDGTTAASISGATLVGVISPDVVTVSGGGTFASPNVGTNIAVTANLSLGGANAGNYSLTQPNGLKADITKANPLFATSPISLNVGGTYTLPGANISSTSNGVFSYSITPGGFATYDGVVTLTGISAGTETLTVNQAATSNFNAGSTTVTVDVSVISYTTGDYRTNPNFTNNIYFNSTNPSNSVYPWQRWNGTSWVDVSHSSGSPNSPQNLATKPETIYIGGVSYVDIAGGATYNNIILDDANTILYSGNTTTGITIAAGKTMNIKAGYFDNSGKLVLSVNSNLFVRTDAEFEIRCASYNFLRDNTSNFTVEDGGFVYVNNYLTNIWAGNENFGKESVFVIYGWNKDELLFSNESDISNNSVGSKFGDLIFEIGSSGISGNWTYVLPSGNYTLTNKDFDITNNNSNNITLNPGTVTIGGNFIINGTGNVQGSTQAGAKIFNVKGNFLKKGTGNFRLNSGTDITQPVQLNVDGNFEVNDGFFVLDNNSTDNLTSEVNLKGNLTKATGSYMTNSNTNSTNVRFNFIGNPTHTPQTVNVNVRASNDMLRYYFYVKSNAYVQLSAQDWKLATSSSITVENGGILDFGFNNATPLNVIRNGSQISQSFELLEGGTLKITSPDGISEGGVYTGNVQVGAGVGTRKFNSGGVYHYIGKANQITGKGLPRVAANKHLIVELAADNLEFTSSNGIVYFNNPSSAIGPDFKGLEIRKGIVISDNSGNRFEDSTGSGEKGNLKMTGGIFRITAKGTQPSLSGVYELELPSKIDFNFSHATETQSIRAVNDDFKYANIDVSGSSVNHAVGNIVMKANTTFDIKPNAVFSSSGNVGQIISLDNSNKATLIVENNGKFVTEREKGFYGPVDGINPSPSVRNNVDVTLAVGSTVEYTRNSPQLVSVFTPGYQKLKISGTGPVIEKDGSGDGVEIKVNQTTDVTSTGKLIVKETDDDKLSNVLSALGGITVQNGGELTFENNAQLMQNSSAVNSGNINVKRKFNFKAARKEYNFVISPVVGQNLKTIYGSPNSPYALRYEESNDYFYSSDGSYIEARALAVKEQPGSGTATIPAVFTGGIFNGNSDAFVLKRQSNATNGFNLTGNPYPSNLNLIDLYYGNSNNIYPTFYFWDNRNNGEYEQQGSTYNGDQYAKFNALNETGVNATSKAPNSPGGAETRIPNSFAKVGTGFLIQTKEGKDGEKLHFENDYRKTDNGPGFFGKPTTIDRDRYWLTLDTPGGMQAMNAVVYYDGGNNDFWLDDTESSNSSDNIFTVLEGKKISIQGKSVFSPDDQIILGYMAYNDGYHFISVYKKEGIFETGTSIYLIDTQLNKVWNISHSPYKFNTKAGEQLSRFKIVYKRPPMLGTVSDIYIPGVQLLKKDGQIIASSEKRDITQFEVYDLNGQPLFIKSEIHATEYKTDIQDLESQIFIVRVQTQDGKWSSKKFLK